MNICFLLSHIPNPRINKRIALAKQNGEVTVVCVRRASQDLWEPFFTDVKHEILSIDLPPVRQFAKRLLSTRKFSQLALELLAKYQPDLIYIEGSDALGIALRYRKKAPCRIIYEVADLRENYFDGSKSTLSRLLSKIIIKREELLLKHVDKLVVTSEKFYDMFYCRLISREDTLFMPNLPDPALFSGFKKKSSGKYTVGFIGGIRYLNQMKMLVDVAGSENCNVLFAGAGGTAYEFDEIQAYCKNKDYVSFYGKYDYARDIAKLYGMVDSVYSVYDSSNANVRIALPNKLYEAVYCEIPIIVAKDTYLAELVEKWGVGTAVSDNDPNELKSALHRLSTDASFYNSIVDSCRAGKAIIDPTPYNMRLSAAFSECK